MLFSPKCGEILRFRAFPRIWAVTDDWALAPCDAHERIQGSAGSA
jgi:hypothetical protein